MQIEFWVEVYFETRRFRPLSSSPLSYTVFAPTLFNPCKSSSPLDWIKSRLVDLCATQIAVKFRTAPHYCKTNVFPMETYCFFRCFLYQLWFECTLHVHVSSSFRSDSCAKQVPLLSAIMSGRKKSDYKALMRAVFELLPWTPSVMRVTPDYERAVWSVLRKLMPVVTI